MKKLENGMAFKFDESYYMVTPRGVVAVNSSSIPSVSVYDIWAVSCLYEKDGGILVSADAFHEKMVEVLAILEKHRKVVKGIVMKMEAEL